PTARAPRPRRRAARATPGAGARCTPIFPSARAEAARSTRPSCEQPVDRVIPRDLLGHGLSGLAPRPHVARVVEQEAARVRDLLPARRADEPGRAVGDDGERPARAG